MAAHPYSPPRCHVAAAPAETDQPKRARLWAKLQALMCEEAPIVRPGAAFSLMLSRRGLAGFTPRLGMVLWNVQAVT
jgi:hypothetical protein